MQERAIYKITNEECVTAAGKLWDYYVRHFSGPLEPKVYGVPRGGIPVAYLVSKHGGRVVSVPEQANLIVDDIVDSGATQERHSKLYPNAIFLSLAEFAFAAPEKIRYWVSFPWEVGDRDTSADDIVIRLLEYIGENPKREGLLETPQRVLKAWKHWTSGYGRNPEDVIKTFEDGAESYDEMIVVRNLPYYSFCEHHMAPFFGTATIAYLPDSKIVGLSKLGRVLDIFARRLQVQERMTTQIADALDKALRPKGVGVLLKGRHFCMESRGIATQGHETITSALRGVFMQEGVRAEFFSLANQK